MKILKHMPVALALLLSIVSVSFAQQPTPTPRPEPDYVTEKGFKSSIFDVKYRDAAMLAQVLRPSVAASKARPSSPTPNSRPSRCAISPRTL